VPINLAGQQIQSATEWTSDTPLKVEGGNLNVQIAPGSLAIVELR
jgi:hypothetical protein